MIHAVKARLQGISESLRNRLGMELGSFKLFLAFAAIFLVLMGALVIGLIFTSSAFSTSLRKPGGGLLDGLIANGISVIVSTILIAPLTAYFVTVRREQQLVPVRKYISQSSGSIVSLVLADARKKTGSDDFLQFGIS